MLKRFKTLVLVGATATIALAGCGQVPTSQPIEAEAMSMVSGQYSTMSADEAPGVVPRRLAAHLGLSEEQKAQLKAIAKQYRAGHRAEHQAQRAALRTLLLAEQVDGAALRGLLASRAQAFEAKAPERIAMLAEMRGVLSAEQRERLAQVLEKPPAKAKRHFEGMREQIKARMLADLNLSGEQRAAIDALASKAEALRQGGHREAARQAFAAFVRTGDQAALRAANAGKVASLMPVDELVRVAESLSLEQRQAIAKKLERFAKLHHKGFGT